MFRTVSFVSTTPSATTLAPLRDRHVDVGREVAIALQAVLVIRDVGERRPALPAGDRRIFGVDAVEMVHRQRFADAQQVRLKAAQRVLGLELEDVVGELVRLAELVARDRMQRRQFLLRGCALVREMPVAEQVADPVGIAEVAAIEGLKRIAPEASLRRCP